MTQSTLTPAPNPYVPQSDSVARPMRSASPRPAGYIPEGVEEQERQLYEEQKRQEHQALHRTVSSFLESSDMMSFSFMDNSLIGVKLSSVLNPKCAMIFPPDVSCRNRITAKHQSSLRQTTTGNPSGPFRYFQLISDSSHSQTF